MSPTDCEAPRTTDRRPNDLVFELSIEDAMDNARTEKAREHLRRARQHEVIAREDDR